MELLGEEAIAFDCPIVKAITKDRGLDIMKENIGKSTSTHTYLNTHYSRRQKYKSHQAPRHIAQRNLPRRLRRKKYTNDNCRSSSTIYMGSGCKYRKTSGGLRTVQYTNLYRNLALD
jgi:hypothetical protein